MRVLHVIESFGVGGAEQSLRLQLKYLKPLGCESKVFTFFARGGLEAATIAEGTEVISGTGKTAPNLVALGRLIHEFSPDLIHTCLFRADLLGRVAAVVSRKPILTTIANMPYEPARLVQDARVKSWKIRAVQELEAVSGIVNERFHAVSHAVKDAAHRSLRYPLDRISVVERGRDRTVLGEPTEERRRVVREAMGVRPTDQVLIAIGRREVQKGFDTLLEAFEQVAEVNPHAVLWVAGKDGARSADLDAQRQRMRHGARVHFLGNRNDIADLMTAADVFVLTSHWEGLPGALLEACAMGRPSVCSDIPPVQEVIGDTGAGVIFPTGNASACASALRSLLADQDAMRDAGAAARARFEDRFRIERTAERILRLYEHTAARRAGPCP